MHGGPFNNPQKLHDTHVTLRGEIGDIRGLPAQTTFHIFS